MRVRSRALIVGALLAMTLAIPAAAPVAAGPPTVIEVPIVFVFPDFENRLVVFANTNRELVCSGVSEPALTLVEVKQKVTGNGAIVSSFMGTWHIELWQMDDDAPGTGPCEDTAGQSAAWATGSVRVKATDNDLDVTLTRDNVFGDRGNATVTDIDGGQWKYSWIFRAKIAQDGEFEVLVERSTLRSR